MPALLVRIDRRWIEPLVAVAELERDRAATAKRHGAVKARAASGVAGAFSGLLDLDPDGVLIAVEPHLDHALGVARGLTLLPQPRPRAAVIPGRARLDGAEKRFGIHMRDHQHIARAH